jgi:cation:H+ antiporter
MEIVLLVVGLLIGFVLIIKGGDWFVDAAVYFAKITGIPSFIIGATIVSLATTLPEVLVSVFASRAGNVDLAIGNAYGSVIANLGLILGISLSISPPRIQGKGILQKGIFMIALTFLTLLLLKDLQLSGTESIMLWVMLVLFLWLNIMDVKTKEKKDDTVMSSDTKRQVVFFALGALFVVVGAELLVTNASRLAEILNISQAVIGLTIVAIGTSLPEFVTTIMSLIKKEAGLSIGNIIGANVLNMSLAIPASVLAANNLLTARLETIMIDIPFALWFMAITIIPPVFYKRFFRWQGYLLLLSYVTYIIYTII